MKGDIVNAYIDIENSHTKRVITLEVPIHEHIKNKIIKFDISNLSKEQIIILENAISELPELSYTDIELFFINNDNIPNFGPDYDFYIKDNILIGIYNRNIYQRNN